METNREQTLRLQKNAYPMDRETVKNIENGSKQLSKEYAEPLADSGVKAGSEYYDSDG